MKATRTAEAFEAMWNNYMSRTTNKHYMNLEEDLDHYMEIFKDSELPEEALNMLRSIKAKEIATKVKSDLIKQMKTVKAIKEGKASLGYISQVQEIQETFEFFDWFEFNCYQLSVFKKKYGLDR